MTTISMITMSFLLSTIRAILTILIPTTTRFIINMRHKDTRASPGKKNYEGYDPRPVRGGVSLHTGGKGALRSLHRLRGNDRAGATKLPCAYKQRTLHLCCRVKAILRLFLQCS